ncbi:hypothetical protein Desaf_3149 [Desulfocurvibacter africanus subsp. africanus str. Walvis Bay]|uniref:Uncharacterized protein n=1 Tax=Desulfocurvibacter africanus subsp. africanus str. Walvis Bay TaxID=690850 RepID=F3Z3A6_DESAF|nr:hypothetical protein Desaf_3149 [Desulfocurvibacter africanus subsp. africanus str. Walvis Bay]
MHKIPLSVAKAGMLLAEPVCRASGMVVVGQGCELNEFLLSRLKEMGIDSVVVVSTEIGCQAPCQCIWSDRAARLDHLFRKHSGDAWMEEVKSHLKNYFLLRSSIGETRPSENAETADKGA